MNQDPRQLAFLALRSIHRGAFADVALDKALQQSELSDRDKRLLTELVYGSVRRQRTLDALIDQLGKKNSQQQPPDLRLMLHLGLYQLRYLTHIPASAAVNTTVDLAKRNGFSGLTGVVNGLLRQYMRLGGEGQDGEMGFDVSAQPNGRWGDGGNEEEGEEKKQSSISNLQSPISNPHSSLLTPHSSPKDPLHLPTDPVQRLGILHSYPDWIIEMWQQQFGGEETEQLCRWMNQSPVIDLRVNRLKVSVEQVESAMQDAGVQVARVPLLPQALRLVNPPGAIQKLPGFQEGWWMVQDSSAQLVSHLLDPQPGETIVDACAAPGGKAIHLAELMDDRGTIWACDKTASRLKKLQQNCDRLSIQSIRITTGDSRDLPQFVNQVDRVLVDAPCSGLGTLHRHADARWRQTPETVQALVQLQTQLLEQAASWVKLGGTLVYATCTLHPAENEQLIERFLANHSEWKQNIPPDSPFTHFVSNGWIKVLPHHHSMDGFFMTRLQRS